MSDYWAEKAKPVRVLEGDAALRTVTKGDTIRIIPDKGPERVMVVSHVEHHVITLSDPADRAAER
jgi:hypothetical protein